MILKSRGYDQMLVQVGKMILKSGGYDQILVQVSKMILNVEYKKCKCIN